MKILYIAGSGRAGSTILGQMLGQIDGFFSVGEAGNLWQRGLVEGRRCGCGRPVPDCPAWSAIVDRGFGTVDAARAQRLSQMAREHDRARSIPRLLARRAPPDPDPEYERALGSLYEAIEEVTRSRVIVDSSKSPIYATTLEHAVGPVVYVVHLIRDPRAAAYSWRRKKTLPDFGDDRLMATQTPFVTARRWLKAQALTELLWRPRAGRYMVLRYEDLLRDPADALRRMCALVGGDAVDLPLSGPNTVRLGVTHSVSGNPTRFSGGPVELRLDDEWVDSQRVADRRVVTAMTWPLLWRYGYQLHPSR
jgi:hypothetical protein